ncbi:MAG: prepilin-type N-terminal cleavage/methylation domain-containing protein [Desulfobacterales bacterium]|jgi:type IV pilus assembly protein PilV
MPTICAKNESGFSIIEMLIALAILAVGMLAIGRMQLQTVRNTTNGNTITQATMLAQAKMEQVKNTEDITTLANEIETDIDADGNPGGIYTRTTTITTPAAPLDDFLRTVRVQVRWVTVHGGDRTLTIDSVTHGQGI